MTEEEKKNNNLRETSWTGRSRSQTCCNHALNAVNINPSKASLDTIDIIKFAGGICGGVLVKDYAVYKKWINE